MKIINNNQKGFTIVELLIASAVFSFVILGASVAIIQMSRLYYKGIIVSNTQTTAKDLLESITRAIQYESAGVSPGPTFNSTKNDGSTPITGGILCVGDNRYTYALGVKQGSEPTSINHVMWKDKGVCSVASAVDLTNPGPGGIDMLSGNMRIANLEVNNIKSGGTDTNLYEVNLTIIYGDDDLINGTDCKGNIAGSQWCSAVNYKTMVFKRIN